MANAGKSVDWDSYTDAYIGYINAYDIKKFFEMDIDSVAGLKKAESLRARIEAWSVIWELMLTTYIIKWIVAVCDTPFIYLAKKIKPRE